MSATSGTGSSAEATAENKHIVGRFFEIFSTGDIAALLDAMTDDSSWWVSGRIKGMSGRYGKSALGVLIEGAKSMYKTGCLVIKPSAMIAEGDKVAVEADGFAELLDGRMYQPHYHFLVTVRSGKVFEVREYMDTDHAKEIFFSV